MDKKLRARVIERDTRCRVCGLGMFYPVVHHRQLRSQGGADSMENLIALHAKCHHDVHMNPEWSYEHGWLVHSWDDPGEIQIGTQRKETPW